MNSPKIEYYPNGKIKSSTHYKEARVKGAGQTRTETVEHGKQEFFYESGNVHIVRTNSHNIGYIQDYKIFYESGETKLKTKFKRGRRSESLSIHYENGLYKFNIGLVESFQEKEDREYKGQQEIQIISPEGARKRILLKFKRSHGYHDHLTDFFNHDLEKISNIKDEQELIEYIREVDKYAQEIEIV